MSVWVERNRHGYLGFRIALKGQRYWVGTKYRDEGKARTNRRLVEAKAVILEETLETLPLDEALLEVLGSCPVRLLKKQQEIRRPSGATIREYYDEWIKRKAWPIVRVSAAKKYRWSIEAHVLPRLGKKPLRDLSRQDLMRLRAELLEEETPRKTKRSLKTVRNIIDWHLRALWNDALADELVDHDPFTNIKWPRVQSKKVDPFESEERDKIIAWYWSNQRNDYWWVYSAFWSGTRPGEAAALRRGDVDLTRGLYSITKSRDEKREGAPKTPGSVRDIPLLPWLREELRKRPEETSPRDDDFFFTTKQGGPMTDSWWPKRSWYGCLTELKIRTRKFYATRHTFISWALTQPGCNLKGLAEYCGTSVMMIEQRYGKYMRKDFLEALVGEEKPSQSPTLEPTLQTQK
jgi:integrase